MTTHERDVPPGIRDLTRRTQTNPVIRDEAYIEKYGAETDRTFARASTSKLAQGVAFPSTTVIPAPNISTLKIVTWASLSEVGEEIKALKPGEMAKVPIGTKHRFFNGYTDRDITFSAELRPANEGFEQSLHIIYGMARVDL
ncbi:hypothetical protein MMC28_008407 [Mycoblastus sanguinarius]|nr:hypothetical protein [Mycoblastus sanguinarius]